MQVDRQEGVWRRWAKAAVPYGIGTMAAFWILQRAVSLM
jgi:hypothetical protein